MDLYPRREYDVLPMWPQVGCNHSLPYRGGMGRGPFPLPHREGWGGSYMHDVMPNVVAMAVRMVITMLRILPQVELLLNVPILFRVQSTELKHSEYRVQIVNRLG